VDPDDWVLPGALEACVEKLESNSDIVAAYTMETWVNESGVLRAEIGESLYQPFIGKPQEALRAHHLTVIRRSALPDLSFMDDYPICAEQALKQRLWAPEKFAFVPMQGYVWRRKSRPSPVVIDDRTPQVQSILKQMGKMYQWLQ
jgi:hypothetical protein